MPRDDNRKKIQALHSNDEWEDRYRDRVPGLPVAAVAVGTGHDPKPDPVLNLLTYLVTKQR